MNQFHHDCRKCARGNKNKIDKNTAVKNPAFFFILHAPFKLKISMDS